MKLKNWPNGKESRDEDFLDFEQIFRHKEMAAAMAPTLPAVREEDDEVVFVEFGETELHRQAKLPSSSSRRNSIERCLKQF